MPKCLNMCSNRLNNYNNTTINSVYMFSLKHSSSIDYQKKLNCETTDINISYR